MAARLLEMEAERDAAIAKLKAELNAPKAQLMAERDMAIAERDAAIACKDKLQVVYRRLLEHYALLKRRVFVAKAERIDHQQLEMEFEAVKRRLDDLAGDLGEAPFDDSTNDGDSPLPPPKKRRAKPKGRRNLRDADLEEVRVELVDESVSESAEQIGFEESYQLGYRRGGPVRIVIARPKYKMADADDEVIRTVEKPRELMRRGLLAPSMIAHILVAKYCYGLPFHRQVAMLKAEGVDLDDSVMCRYAEHIGASLGPIVDACAKEARATAFCLSTDATGVSIQPERLPGKKGQPCHRGHFFVVLADQDHVFFQYARRHNGDAICEILRNFSGYVQADAHSIYHALFRGEAVEEGEKPPDEVACWAHARRKFWEAATVTKDPVAKEAMLRLKKLFDLEKEWAKLPPVKRASERQRVLKPILLEFFRWLSVRHDEAKGIRGLLSSATGYAVRHEEALLRFVEDGRLMATNNHSERALRPIAVGRKAWLFIGSDDHAQSAANLFSLIASCKLHGIDPENYLRESIRIMPLWPRERYLELAPRYWTETRARLEPGQLSQEIGPITVPPLLSKEQPSAD